MAKPPRWMKLETTGLTDRGNMGVRIVIRWWAVPGLFLAGIWRLLTGQLTGEIPDSCDGIEHVGTRIG